MTFLMGFALFVLLLLVLVRATGRFSELRREIQALSHRIARLEQDRDAPQGEPVPPSAAPPAVPVRAPNEIAPPHAPPVVPVAHAPVTVTPAHAPRPATRPADAEQWIGAVGLQNVGSVLLLVGFFFLVLWGYTTGRFGPLVLVAAGALAGIGVVWRGDRLRRTVQGLGDALLGVGAGIVWLSLYLGWTTLHALSGAEALPLLFIASALTGALGLRYRVEGISALGLIGAFLPHLLRFVVTLPEAPLPPWSLFGYLVSINVLVFVLAMRSGWSRLALASVLLTAVTWSSAVATDRWSWPLEIGLAGLFLSLGIAPLPRLVRVEGGVQPVDLALIATAPAALLAASWPMFSLARSEHVAIVLGALAALYLALALAVDLQRPERDVWRPLTAAATLFLTVALERAVGPEYTGLAWAVEGSMLAWLGLAPRSGWLRGCGSVVALAAVYRVLPGLLAEGFASVHPVPFVHAQAVREAVVIAALLFGAWRLERAASTPSERWLGHGWLMAAHLLLTCWLVREMDHLAWAMESGSGMWRSLRDLRAPPGDLRYVEMFATFSGLALMAQAAWLVWGGTRDRSAVTRVLGHGLGFMATLVLAFTLRSLDAWGRDLLPIAHRDAFAGLAAVLLAVFSSSWLARRRETLSEVERRSAEIWALAAAFVMLFWLAREADHVARVMIDTPGAYAAAWAVTPTELRDRVLSLGAILASVAWLAQAVAVFAFGWARHSAFLRWMALALLGLTLIKFVLVDLAHADPFWRFLTALLAGGAMLALSFVYQRLGLRRGAGAEARPATEPAAQEE